MSKRRVRFPWLIIWYNLVHALCRNRLFSRMNWTSNTKASWSEKIQGLLYYPLNLFLRVVVTLLCTVFQIPEKSRLTRKHTSLNCLPAFTLCWSFPFTDKSLVYLPVLTFWIRSLFLVNNLLAGTIYKFSRLWGFTMNNRRLGVTAVVISVFSVAFVVARLRNATVAETATKNNCKKTQTNRKVNF